MKEFITGSFYKNLEEKRPIQIRGTLDELLGQMGCEGSIGFYNIEVDYKLELRKSKFRACVKELDPESIYEHKESGVNEVIEKYLHLKKIGLPVIPFLRGDVENNFILMTDMTENNSRTIVDKHNPLKNDFSIDNIDTIKEELFKVAGYSYFLNFYLNADAYSISVDNESRQGKLHLIDIGARSQFIKDDAFWIDENLALSEGKTFLELSNIK